MITWPRMQNVLLGISAFLIITLFWSEMCYGYDAEGMRYSIKFTEHIQFLVFTFITAALAIAAIFYKKQYILQVRVCIINMLILLGYQIWLVVAFFQLKSAYTFTLYTLFPFVCITLHFLAITHSWRDATDVIARDFHKKMGKKLKK
ncbi:MAG: DUF4293 family protein [Bacteroidales bacterium]|nr:DUF4293 family protein [Bacteroidales bacterium]